MVKQRLLGVLFDLENRARTLGGVERRWVDEVLSSFAIEGEGLQALSGEVDYVATFEQMLGASGALAHVGLRAGVALCSLSTWPRHRKRLAELSPRERAAHLDALLSHDAFLVRELSFFVKVQASLALLGAPAVRARSSYDRSPHDRARASLREPSSGTRRLPVLSSTDAEPNREGEVA